MHRSQCRPAAATRVRVAASGPRRHPIRSRADSALADVAYCDARASLHAVCTGIAVCHSLPYAVWVTAPGLAALTRHTLRRHCYPRKLDAYGGSQLTPSHRGDRWLGSYFV